MENKWKLERKKNSFILPFLFHRISNTKTYIYTYKPTFYMKKKVILAAFEKAKEETGSSILTHQAQYISGYLTEDCGYSFGERRLRQYFINCKKGDEIEINQKVLQHLCNFLDFNDFNDFKSNFTDKPFPKKNYSKKRIKTIAIPIIILVLSYVGYDMTKKDCMIWVENSHYEKVRCEDKIKEGAVLYNEVVFEKFKRIDPNCDYAFFNSEGQENLWYLKRKNGDIEYFTYYGFHPIANKTLKPITQYIINKYICNK